MKLYDVTRAPNPRRVRIVMAEKGIEAERIELDLLAGDNLTDAYRLKHPFARVPVLELDDGSCIGETTAICQYLEALVPEPNLLGHDPLEKARIEMWHRWVDDFFMQPTGMCFQHQSGYFSDRREVVPQWGAVCRQMTLDFLDLLETRLTSRSHVVAGRFTIVDITTLCTIDFNKVNRIHLDDRYPAISAWYERINQRPSFSA